MTEDHMIDEQGSKNVDEFRKAIIDNEKIITAYDEKYLPAKSRSAPTWDVLGAVTSYQETDTGLIVRCERGFVELVWVSSDAVRVRVQQDTDDFRDYFSYYVADTNWEQVNLRISDSVPYSKTDTDTIYIETDTHTFRINREQFALAVDTHYGRTIYSETVGIGWNEAGGVRLQTQLAEDEASYGTGERAFNLNLRGRKLDFWNTDPGGYDRGDDPINYCVSFYLGLHSIGAYGLLWDNSTKGVFDIGASVRDELTVAADGGEISYYVFAGETVESVLSAYSKVTGRMQMPPMWALGYQQCRYSYMDADEVLEVATKMRKRHIPCDVIYLDIHYMDDFRVFTWDEEAFGDMQTMIDRLHNMGMKLVVILDPGVKVDEGYAGHDTGVEQGAFVTYPDGELAAGVVWPGLCYFPDFTDPKARAWWSEQLNNLLSKGVDGLWNDMNEPLIFPSDGKPKALPSYVKHSKEGQGADHIEMHNVYGMQMGRASLAALEHNRPKQRQFNIIRAGAAGAQRYTCSWTGDNHSTWDDLRLALTTTLQMGLSGIAFTGADVGGFGGDTTPELLTRWTQAGSLLPLFRNHSAIGTIRQEPWAFGEPYEQYIREAIELRYQLLPYLYTAFAEAAFDGLPIVRPIFMAEPHNASIRDVDDSYLVGEKILVAPVLTDKALRRTLYLPDGLWYDFHTNIRYEGGKVISVESPLNRLPLFVRSGTVLPMWDVLQFTSEQAVKTPTLRLYIDTGETRIYEDAGEGLGYQDGDYRWLHFMSVESTNYLMLERTATGNYTPDYQQVNLEIVGSRSELQSVEVDGATLANDKWHFTDGILYATLPAEFSTVKVAN